MVLSRQVLFSMLLSGRQPPLMSADADDMVRRHDDIPNLDTAISLDAILVAVHPPTLAPSLSRAHCRSSV
jgi:hypothetical protein